MEALHRSAIRSLALLMTVLLTEIALGAGQSVTAVSARPCRVVNVTQGKHFPPDSGGALAAAIVAANADDQLTITGICTGTYTLDQHIALTGVATQQFPIPTIDGGQSGSTLSVATGVTAILTDLTITGGTGVPDPVHLGAPGDGGGIVNNGSLTLVSCVVSGNTASRNGNGGGIYNRGSLVVRGASVVTQNTAENEGGGIYILSGNVSVKESSTVSRNVASDFGGGIINGGALTIDASTVTLNRANFGAGGIRNFDGATMIVQNSSTVSENEVTFDGGGILNHGTAIVSSSTVSGNIGSGTGGGISNSGGVVTLTSSTVSGNQNGTGGGIYNATGTVTLNSSHVTGNTAFVSGGGIYNTGTVNLSSSVITGNMPDNCVGVLGC